MAHVLDSRRLNVTVATDLVNEPRMLLQVFAAPANDHRHHYCHDAAAGRHGNHKIA